MRYITGGVPWTDDQIRSFVERQVKLYSERGFCRWKLVSKASGEMIGFCGVDFGATRRTRSSDGGWRVATGVTGWRRKRLLPRCRMYLNGYGWSESLPLPCGRTWLRFES